MSSFAGAYNLYESTVAYRYDLDAIIKSGVEDDQAYIDAVCKQVFPGIPVKVEAPKFACSAFCAEAPSSVLMGRNYDFKDDTSALLVRTHPKDGYASISFSALNNLGANIRTLIDNEPQSNASPPSRTRPLSLAPRPMKAQ